MPEQNDTLQKIDIPGYNNLITNIGYKSYVDVLKSGDANDPLKLTPKAFTALVNKEISSFLIQ